jgi:NhaC family Na+:H+ antiporter
MSQSAEPPPSRPLPSIAISLLPVFALIGLLFFNVIILKSDRNHVPLILAAMFAAIVAVVALKVSWTELEKGIVHAIQSAMIPILILMAIGIVIAAWMQAGVVPLLIVYGLDLISPSVFLLTTCVVCAVVSLATGSSWTTAGTVGVALIGAGTTLGLDVAMVAGAVVSGSYFGDKMSPLSDTTNLAPAMAGSTLVEHIRHMVWTVTPAILLALIGYTILGFRATGETASLEQVQGVIAALESGFNLGPWLLIPPALTLGLVMFRFPAVPALLFGALSAVLVDSIASLAAGKDLAMAAYFENALAGFTSSTGHEVVDELLSRGGMDGMMGTVALVLCAMAFGGVMTASRMLESLTTGLLRMVRGTGSLIATTLFTCFGVNVLTADQYMAIVLPGRMFKVAYLKRGLHPKNLSRALEDSGTVTSPLIPWNTCGAQMAMVLGVSATLYWKFAFLNLLCPVVSLIYGFTGFTITKISPEEAAERLKTA